jgi:hypothetical protein
MQEEKLYACVEKSFAGTEEGKPFCSEDFKLSANPLIVVLLSNEETKQTNIVVSDANKFGKIVETDDLFQSMKEDFEKLEITLREQEELLKEGDERQRNMEALLKESTSAFKITRKVLAAKLVEKTKELQNLEFQLTQQKSMLLISNENFKSSSKLTNELREKLGLKERSLKKTSSSLKSELVKTVRRKLIKVKIGIDDGAR